MADYESLAPREDMPHVPVKAEIAGDPACNDCALKTLAGHLTCASMRPKEPATVAERFPAKDIDVVRGKVFRRSIMTDGVPGQQVYETDSWYQYRAAGSLNYADFSLWEVLSVEGDDSDVLNLKTISGSPREYGLFTWRTSNPDNPLITIGDYIRMGCLQPGDIGIFENNKMRGAKWPLALQVLDSNPGAGTLKLRVDKNCSGAMSKIDPESEEPVKIRFYQHAGNPYKWQYLRKPVWFSGRQVVKEVESSEVPGDGLITLSGESPVMHPPSVDPLHPVWTAEGWDGSEWVTVDQQDERLFVVVDAAVVALKTTTPDEANADITLSTDLTTVYSKFRFTFYEYVSTEGGEPCVAVGYAQCLHAQPDKTASDYGDGVTAGVEGTGWYCAMRLYDTYEISDSDSDGYDDTVTRVPKSATGASRFPSHGRCLQHGCCDKFTPAESDTSREAPFNYQHHAALVLGEIWAASNQMRFRPNWQNPGFSGEHPTRIMHPSLCWLAGYVRLDTPVGYHPQSFFRDGGEWGGEPVVHVDENDDEHIVKLTGPWEGYTWVGKGFSDGEGVYPEFTPDFISSRDPALPPPAIYPFTLLERVGLGVQRDTGEITGHGLSASSVAVKGQSLVFAPHIDLTLKDTVQTRHMGTVERKTGGAPITVKISPLRQEGKSEIALGSRVVHSTSRSGDLVTIDFKNESVTWGIPNPSSQSDPTVSWKAGGRWPICPQQYQELVNYYTENKQTGSRMRGAWRGDAAEIEGHRYMVHSVSPHGGSIASDWESGHTPQDDYSVSGSYTQFGRRRDQAVLLDYDNQLTNLSPDDTVVFYKQAMVLARPAVLEWTEYGEDNWQPVEGSSHHYGEGLWEIPDSWADGKPDKVCFRATGCELVDHRGIVPGSLLQKTVDAVDSLEWVLTRFSGGGGEFGIGKAADIIYGLDVDPDTGCRTGQPVVNWPLLAVDFSPTQNRVIISKSSYMAVEGECAASVEVLPLTTLGLPHVFRLAPKGAELLEAKMEISTTGLTRTFTQYKFETTDCDDKIVQPEFNPPPDVTLTDIDYSLIGHKSETEWEVIGSVPGAGNGRKVVDATELVQTMWDTAEQYPYGYSVVFIPPDYSGDITELVPKDPPEIQAYLQGDCTGCGQSYLYNETWSIVYTWGSVQVDSLALKFKWPDETEDWKIIQPRWPSMGGLIT